MSWTKEHYEEDGRKAALHGYGLGPCPDQDGWRKDAWLHGYDQQIAVQAPTTGCVVVVTPNLQSIPISSPETAQVKAVFRPGKEVVDDSEAARCPPVVREHIRCLYEAINAKSCHWLRKERLHAKIITLIKRHTSKFN